MSILHVVSVSGGKDSAATAILALELVGLLAWNLFRRRQR